MLQIEDWSIQNLRCKTHACMPYILYIFIFILFFKLNSWREEEKFVTYRCTISWFLGMIYFFFSHSNFLCLFHYLSGTPSSSLWSALGNMVTYPEFQSFHTTKALKCFKVRFCMLLITANSNTMLPLSYSRIRRWS